MKIYKSTNGKCNICGPKIKELRESSKFSQEQLAAKLQLVGLNLTQKTVSRIESGERVVPDYELLYFAKVFDVTVAELLESNLR